MIRKYCLSLFNKQIKIIDMTINQIKGLNRKARAFLLDHCVSRRGVEVMAFNFNGYINGQTFENTTLIRINSKWQVFSTKECIISIYGEIDCFNMTRNTIL